MSDSRTDADLLACLSSDPQALEELYRRWGPRWAGLVRAAGVPPDDVADVLQRVLLEVWQHGQRFDPRQGSSDAWLLQIARFRTIDFLRRRKNNRLEWSESLAEDLVTPDPHDAIRIDDALKTLSRRDQQVIHLLYHYGFTQKEIARMWRVPHGTVKSWISRALAKLLQELTEEGGETR